MTVAYTPVYKEGTFVFVREAVGEIGGAKVAGFVPAEAAAEFPTGAYRHIRGYPVAGTARAAPVPTTSTIPVSTDRTTSASMAESCAASKNWLQ